MDYNVKALPLMSRGSLVARTEAVAFADVRRALERLRAGDVTGRLVVRYE